MLEACPVCKVSWLGEEIPVGLMAHSPGYYDTREKAEKAAEHYGWTPENKQRFLINVIGIKYQGKYDGVLEWRCTACRARVGRFSGRILGDNEIDNPYGQ